MTTDNNRELTDAELSDDALALVNGGAEVDQAVKAACAVYNTVWNGIITVWRATGGISDPATHAAWRRADRGRFGESGGHPPRAGMGEPDRCRRPTPMRRQIGKYGGPPPARPLIRLKAPRDCAR